MRWFLPLVLFACSKPERPAPLPNADKPLALLARPTLRGDTFDPGSVAGKVVVVNVWSPGCVPCVKEAPGLQRAADALADRGLALVTLMVDGLAGFTPLGPRECDPAARQSEQEQHGGREQRQFAKEFEKVL